MAQTGQPSQTKAERSSVSICHISHLWANYLVGTWHIPPAAEDGYSEWPGIWIMTIWHWLLPWRHRNAGDFWRQGPKLQISQCCSRLVIGQPYKTWNDQGPSLHHRRVCQLGPLGRAVGRIAASPYSITSRRGRSGSCRCLWRWSSLCSLRQPPFWKGCATICW